MLVPKKTKQPGRSARLALIAETAEQLPDEALLSLTDFAEFLAVKYPPAEGRAELEIVPIERPETETVIAAIRRLAKTYPMLDKEILFQQTSQAMSDHVLKEISQIDSIDRLEAVFREEYEALLKRKGS